MRGFALRVIRAFRSKFQPAGLALILIGLSVFHVAQAQSLLLIGKPQDPDYIRQSQLVRIHATAAWQEVSNHMLQREVVVALLDTGVDRNHPDLQGALWLNADEVPGDGIDNDHNSYIDDAYGWDFIESSPDVSPKVSEQYSYEAIHHGTVVAGVVAARANTIGIIGAAHSVKIMPLRVLDALGAGNTLLLSQAIDYAVDNGAHVINLSLVGTTPDDRLSASIERAYNKGIAVVAASGNQDAGGVNLDVSPHYPVCESAGVNRVLGVAALDEQNDLASFSNYGSTCIDVSAPGTNFYSTVFHLPGDDRFKELYSGGWSGTSVAAPLVSATLALIRHVAPNLSLQQAYDIVRSSAQPLTAISPHAADLGAGLLDMNGAVARAVTVSRDRPLYIAVANAAGMSPQVTIRDKEGVQISQFYAYAESFMGGVSATIGDVTGDGVLDVVTVPLSNGGPHVRIFTLFGALQGQFMAYSKFSGGLSLALGDVDADGAQEIIVAPMRGGGPHVRVFASNGVLGSEFFAYAREFSGGVTLTAADVDGDHVDEIITAPASAGGPHVRMFGREGTVRGQFMAFDPSFRGGLTVGAGDVNGDGSPDIVVAQTTPQNIQVRIFNSRAAEQNRFLLYPSLEDRESESRLLVQDYTGDGRDDIISYSISGITPIRVHDFYGSVLHTVVLPVPAVNRALGAYRIAIDA